MERAWAMPSRHTFRIPPIRDFVHREIAEYTEHGMIVDPFCGCSTLATVSNDLNPDVTADYHMDALDFLKRFDADSVDCVLFDPPYSPRQISECYRSVGLDTQGGVKTRSSFYSTLKDEIARIVRVGGIAITCGWNTTGIGASRGFAIEKILDVAHGGAHNDTLIVLNRRMR